MIAILPSFVPIIRRALHVRHLASLSQLKTTTFSLFCDPASLSGSFRRLLALKSCSTGVKPAGKKDWLAAGSSFHVDYLIKLGDPACWSKQVLNGNRNWISFRISMPVKKMRFAVSITCGC